MEAKSIQFELVSPEEKLISEPMGHVVLPGSEGEFGVSAEHTSLVVSLKAGVVQLYKEGLSGDVQKVFIAGGFADVSGENCTVLAEEAVNLQDMVESELQQQLNELRSDQQSAEEAHDKERIGAAIALTEAKLDALKA